MHTMHSRVVVDGDSLNKRNSMPEDKRVEGIGGDGGGGSGVRYYLRRGSVQQLAEKTKQILSGGGATTSSNCNANKDDGNSGGDGNRSRSASSQDCSAPSSRRLLPGKGEGKRAEGGGVNFYLRRASLQGLPFLENFLAGDASGRGGGASDAASERADDDGRSASNTHNPRGNGNDDGSPSAGIARAMMAAVANAEAAAAADDVATAAASAKRDANNGSGDCGIGLEDPNVLDRVEAGRGRISSFRNVRGDSSGSGRSSRGDEPDQREEEREGGGEGAEAGIAAGARTPSATLTEGVQDGGRKITAHSEVIPLFTGCRVHSQVYLLCVWRCFVKKVSGCTQKMHTPSSYFLSVVMMSISTPRRSCRPVRSQNPSNGRVVFVFTVGWPYILVFSGRKGKHS